MNSQEWKERIIQACEQSGTFNTAFDAMIDTLAQIMALRDQALTELTESGEESVTMKVSDRGAQNLAENPRLAVVRDLNRDALAYWRELLVKPMARAKVKTNNGRTLDEVLKQMENE